MKITIIQTDTHWMAHERNACEARKMIDKAETSDMYVLPEMWDTGFNTHPKEADAEAAQRSLQWMQATARETDAAICGSIAVMDGQDRAKGLRTYRNRMYFVRPDGTFTQYDKHHLFAHGGETRHFTAGGERVVAEWRGWRFMLLVCYDLRFPIWARYDGDYDAIINVANWPQSRQTAWDVLTRARAIENQCYLIGCNRAGHDPANTYAGHSRIIAPDGSIAAAAATGGQQAVSARISMEELAGHRRTFGFLNDRDNK